MIKMLVLTVQVFSQFEKDELESSLLNTLWEHSITVGSFARKIAETENAEQKNIDHACMGGLLHDLGKLVLSTKLSKKYVSVIELAKEERLELFKLESEMLGATHAEVGGYLLGLWGLSDPIVESLSFHHYPRKHQFKEFNPVTAVHVANVLDHKLSPLGTKAAVSEIDHDYLTELGLADRLPVWEKVCQNILQEKMLNRQGAF